jgi:hypothetical protein
MESFEHLSELSRAVSGTSADDRLREAHAAMVELDRERGEAVCVWHAGCNTALINVDAVPAERRTAQPS